MTDNSDKKNTVPTDRATVIALGKSSSSVKEQTITNPETFMTLASSLMAFDQARNKQTTSPRDSAQPATRVTGLEAMCVASAPRGTKPAVAIRKADTGNTSAEIRAFQAKAPDPSRKK